MAPVFFMFLQMKCLLNARGNARGDGRSGAAPVVIEPTLGRVGEGVGRRRAAPREAQGGGLAQGRKCLGVGVVEVVHSRVAVGGAGKEDRDPQGQRLGGLLVPYLDSSGGGGGERARREE